MIDTLSKKRLKKSLSNGGYFVAKGGPIVSVEVMS